MLLLALVLVPAALSSKAAAASTTVAGSVLTTSPIAVDLSAKPGHSATTTLQVQNNSPVAETINVRLEKFRSQGEQGEAAIYNPPTSDSSLSWVHFSEDSFTAQPGVWHSITVTINVPPNAVQGYYYAVLFEPQTKVVAGKDKNVVRGANAIFILLDTNSGNENRRLLVSSFTSAKSIYEYLPSTFTVTVQNPGNIYLAPSGDVFITRTKNGKSIASLDINKGQGNVLPHSFRQFQVQWDDGFPTFQPKKINGQVVANSKGQPVEQLQWNTSSSLSKIRFGKYYAHLALVYNNGVTNVTTDAYVSFWVIPWKLILLSIFILAVIIIIWKLIKKSSLVIFHKLKK